MAEKETVYNKKAGIFGVTVQNYEDLKKDVVAKGDKIYRLTPEEKSRYLKDADALYPEVKAKSGLIGNKFIGILQWKNTLPE